MLWFPWEPSIIMLLEIQIEGMEKRRSERRERESKDRANNDPSLAIMLAREGGGRGSRFWPG